MMPNIVATRSRWSSGSERSRPNGRAMSPARFGEVASDGQWACKPHLARMNEIALKVAAGEIERQMTFEPPQTGKSQFWSKWFPAWYLGTFPDRRVILGSYNADNATDWGRQIRDCLEEFGEEFFGVRVRPDQRSADNWGIVGRAGGLRTMGMDGGITGKPAELMLIDDPVKGAEDALSPTIRQRVWDTYVSCVDSRLQPNGAICLTMTPWHEDDLGGRLLEAEKGLWNVLRLPALAEESISAEVRGSRKGYHALMGAPDPLGRPPGQALWPARFNEVHYERKRRLDPFWFDALYQCSPRAREGGMFKGDWFKVIQSVPVATRRVRYWDRAATQGAGDYTVGVLMSELNGSYYVEHVVRGRWSEGERDRVMLETAETDAHLHPNQVEVWIEQEPGSSGKDAAAAIRRKLLLHGARTETASGNKEARARPLASACEAKMVRLCLDDEKKYRHWDVPAFLDEFTGFPHGSKHDDIVDACSGAFNKLALGVASPGPCAMDEADVAALEGSR